MRTQAKSRFTMRSLKAMGIREVRMRSIKIVPLLMAVGLFLGGSSSITPGVPHENLRALIEGLAHYRTHGRGR